MVGQTLIPNRKLLTDLVTIRMCGITTFDIVSIAPVSAHQFMRTLLSLVALTGITKSKRTT